MSLYCMLLILKCADKLGRKYDQRNMGYGDVVEFACKVYNSDLLQCNDLSLTDRIAKIRQYFLGFFHLHNTMTPLIRILFLDENSYTICV